MTQEKVETINLILKNGEPANVSVDEHAGYTGYKPQSVIDAMNSVFWGEWGFEEVSSEITPGDKGGLVVAQVRVWLKGIDFKPTSYGQNRVTRGDLGDARKGAQTDAIKKALSYFSIGNRAYHGLLSDKPVPRVGSNPGASQNGASNSSARPTPITAPSSGQSKPVQDMMARAKQRTERVQMLWDDVKRDTFGGACPADETLTVQMVAQINGVLTVVEKGLKSA